MKKKLIPLILLIAIGGFAFYSARKGNAADTGVIRVSGNIEIIDAALSFKIAGRLAERVVSEGNLVNKDEVAARLDDTDLRQELDLRRAELDAARAALNELLAGSRAEEIAQAQAALARVKSEEVRWRLQYERYRKLNEQQVVSDQDLEAAQSQQETALARVKEATEALELVQKGPRVEQIDKARAEVRRAEQALALAQTRLEYATLASPLSGLVLSENIETGEYVSAGTPVVTVGKIDTVWLRAFIDETDLGRVRVGQSVRVKTDTFPGKVYDGKISFISSESEFTPKTVQTDKERVKLVYRIKIDIDNPHMELKPGMPASGEVVL